MGRRAILGAALFGTGAMLLSPATAQAQQDRVSATEKGSLCIFSKVEIRWSEVPNMAGQFELYQDTFISLTNDFTEDVLVQMYYINGDAPTEQVNDANGNCIERAHPGWNAVDNGFALTMNEPTYWSAMTGQPKGVVPFSVLDPAGCGGPGRPSNDGTGDRVLRGYLIAWAVNSENEQIRWNHLKGEGTIVNYDKGFAWEYNSWNHAVVDLGVNNGDAIGTAGVLKMDGNEYSLSFDELILNFQAAGSAAWSTAPGVMPAHTVVTDTDLTLHPTAADLRQTNDGPVTTKASILIWNENETKFSGTHRCITCWDQTLISQYADPPNSFSRMFLQTDHGKARIDGHAAPDQCDGDGVTSIEAPLLGVYARWLAIDGTVPDGVNAAAGGNLIGLGTDDTAEIKYDPSGAPPELNDPNQAIDLLNEVIKNSGKSFGRN